MTSILQGFPPRECSLHRQKICMFVTFGVPFDGRVCPRKPTTACGANCILRENLCQGAREIIV